MAEGWNQVMQLGMGYAHPRVSKFNQQTEERKLSSKNVWFG